MSSSLAAVNPSGLPPTRDCGALFTPGLCFFLSGVAALVYQTAWMRQFALVFGTSELAVATVLAAYMAGLAGGAWLIERWLPRVRRAVSTYAAIELGIAVSAIAVVPSLLWGCEWLLQFLLGNQPAPPDSRQISTSLYYLLSAFIVLALPTMLMGATLPLLARHAVREDAQIGRRIGALYAINTLGAVAGALIAAFWLLPTFGLTRTVWFGAAINLVVFVLAALWVRKSATSLPVTAEASDHRDPSGVNERDRGERQTAGAPTSAGWILPLMLASGAVSFFHEVFWTRALSHVLGSSLYAFGVMVASFLAGIALGGAIGAVLARSRHWAIAAFAASQVGCAAAAAFAYASLERFVPEVGGLSGNALLAAAILTPLTLFIGATYPLAVRILARQAGDAARVSARIYAWNTVGAIVGALAAGFVLIPWLRFEGAIQVAVMASAALAAASALLLEQPRRELAFPVLAAALLIGFGFRADLPDRLLAASPLHIDGRGELRYYGVGRSASVIVLEQDGGLVLRTNGLPEAIMERPGAAPYFSGELWLSPLAVIARPDAARMLIIGFGGGAVVEGVPPSVREIDVIELEPRVIEANRAMSAYRKRDPLADPRVRIITNDARGALGLTNRRYDAIVSQPSHPWTAGASHLYTKEFMLRVRERLNAGGVFVQWMNLSFVDEALLRSLTATLLHVFGETRIYRPDSSTLVFLASTSPLDLEHVVASTGLPLEEAPDHYGRLGINTAEDLLVALAVDDVGARALAQGAPLLTDDHNRLAASSVHERGGLTVEGAGKLLARFDPLQRADGLFLQRFTRQPALDYVARRLETFARLDATLVDRLHGLAAAAGPTEAGFATRAIALRAEGEHDASERLLRDGLESFPESERLRYELIRPWLGALARDAAPTDIVREAARLPAEAAAIIEAARLSVQGRWEEVRALDPILARAPWTAPWKFEALQTSIDWRTRAGGGPSAQTLGREALEMVDRLIVVQPTLNVYGLRARSAMAAARSDALIESIGSYGRGLFLNARGQTSEARLQTATDLRNLLEALDYGTRMGYPDPDRVVEVKQALSDALQQLGGGRIEQVSVHSERGVP